MTKKLSFLFALMLSTLMASAYDAQINGIYYNLITKAKQAEVTCLSSKSSENSNAYSGSVTIPETIAYNGVIYNVTSIGNWTFNGCNRMTSVTIPNSVTSIGNYAFQSCSSLISVNIPNSLTSIGDYAFYNCKGLKEVHITDLETWCKFSFSSYDSDPLYYAHHLFMDGKEIKDLVIPNSVTSIRKNAFRGCTGLTTVTIPNSVTSIGSGAFYECSGLTSITIPNSVTSIGSHAFNGCTGLTSVTIPNNVKTIGEWAFYNCSSLTSVIIPSSVTSIEQDVFCSCTSLISITIPNSVTSIGDYAFNLCENLTSVTIPNSVTSIGSDAFQNCKSLTSVTIPNSVTSIGTDAFYGCSGLTSVTIGSGVRNISNSAFASCSELADVYCYAENVPSTQSDAFKDSYVDYATLYVPEASLNAYKTRSPWSGFGTIKTLSGDTPPTPETQKCSTPTISYENGKLTFSCETEGATCQYSITDTDIKAGSGNEVQLTTTYKVTVYATKAGYENSDEATLEINVSGGASGLRGDVNNDGTVNMPDAMFIVNKILNGKFPDEE